MNTIAQLSPYPNSCTPISVTYLVCPCLIHKPLINTAIPPNNAAAPATAVGYDRAAKASLALALAVEAVLLPAGLTVAALEVVIAIAVLVVVLTPEVLLDIVLRPQLLVVLLMVPLLHDTVPASAAVPPPTGASPPIVVVALALVFPFPLPLPLPLMLTDTELWILCKLLCNELKVDRTLLATLVVAAEGREAAPVITPAGGAPGPPAHAAAGEGRPVSMIEMTIVFAEESSDAMESRAS